MTKRSIAVILAIFLGGLGIHRMYVGQFKTGIVYLLFGGHLYHLFSAL